MGQQIPNGSQLQIASAIAGTIAVSAASNATECVLTTATNTYAVGDYVEFISGWSLATNRVFRVKAATATSVTLEAFDTTNTTNYPAGGGTGSVRKITTWLQVQQVMNLNFEGGDIKTDTFQYLENSFETEFTTVISARALTFELADDTTLAGYIALKAASDARAQTPFRLVLPSGGIITMDTKPFISQSPTISINQLMTVKGRLSILNEVVRY